MEKPQISTLGELKASGYSYKSIKDELRHNLLQKIKKKEQPFPGIFGYEDTVIPELERAILSRHNINFLGLRGQAKTRLARMMVNLLDQWIPIVAGSEINDDPFRPISRTAKEALSEKGDDLSIGWLHRTERFFEKLATPDVTIADIIGDVDPIKAANLRLSYADDRVIHYGMIPRANRCIFVINELPDLQPRIQVALFNILQEGDIQIRGFKLRLPLDTEFVFTANPEDYTNRGSIVTPLKDRIGSQILTHYPSELSTAKEITAQEVRLDQWQIDNIFVPDLAKDLIEQIGFEARDNEMIDQRSGVSARMSITAYENLISAAERRAVRNNEKKATVRLSDFLGVIPAITGKIELVYEGEQEGGPAVAFELLGSAILTLFFKRFPKIEKLSKPEDEDPYEDIVEWFLGQTEFRLLDEYPEREYKKALDDIPALEDLLERYLPQTPKREKYFLKEFILWGLVEAQKLTKRRFASGTEFRDVYGNFLREL